jgi:serine/threonine protein phosphatase PrpC
VLLPVFFYKKLLPWDVFVFSITHGKKQNYKMQEETLSAVCERVLDRCLAPSTMGGEGCDNMTMILVQFKKPITQTKDASSAEQSAGDTEPSETQ